MTAIKRLYADLKEDRELAAQQKSIAARRRYLKGRIQGGVAWLGAEGSESVPKREWACGCVEVDGILWRDCKTPVEMPNHYGRPPYPYEEKEAAKAKAERDAIVGKGCRRKVA